MTNFVAPKPFKRKGMMACHPFNIQPNRSGKGNNRDRLSKQFHDSKEKS